MMLIAILLHRSYHYHKKGSMIYTFGYRLFIFRDFIHLLSKVATISKDTSPLYVRIGPLQGMHRYFSFIQYIDVDSR